MLPLGKNCSSKTSPTLGGPFHPRSAARLCPSFWYCSSIIGWILWTWYYWSYRSFSTQSALYHKWGYTWHQAILGGRHGGLRISDQSSACTHFLRVNYSHYIRRSKFVSKTCLVQWVGSEEALSGLTPFRECLGGLGLWRAGSRCRCWSRGPYITGNYCLHSS